MTGNVAIKFLRRGVVVEYASPNPMQTVLDYLRLEEKSKGTKEGCNEGDCGACTVALGKLQAGKVVYESVNACILLMAQLHGKELVTVDDLARHGVLHPVQQAMVDLHAAQCGFCTPGFVMSLFTLYHQSGELTRQVVVDHLAGNLCRCTGYRPSLTPHSNLVLAGSMTTGSMLPQQPPNSFQIWHKVMYLQGAQKVLSPSRQRALGRGATRSTFARHHRAPQDWV